jgi:hypothetical protein
MRGVIGNKTKTRTVLAVGGGCATFQQKRPTEIVADGCKTEIDSFCKNVTPGEARVLACLYAYCDKLSYRCKYSLYKAVCQLQHSRERR